MQNFKKLQEWYHSYCDGAWEHQYGIEIGTLDNPGWRVTINLIGTKNENVEFKNIDLERNADDWISCKVENKNFTAACGALNLEEVLELFLKFSSKGLQNQ